MPNLSDLVVSLHGMQYFTSLDLVKGYYQIQLEDSSKEMTAFLTSWNQYQFKCLLFSLQNAPAAFQQEMQNVLKDFSWKSVIVYIDDMLIMEKTFDKHLELVNDVLKTLEEHHIPNCSL